MWKKIGILLVCLFVDTINGHGKMMDPPNRSSIWRVNSLAVPNYTDDQMNCGGKTNQWQVNGGKCGVCGDPYEAPHPQDNENTGLYGGGIIAKTYSVGEVIDVQIILTTNHMGSFNFSLCVLDDPNAWESGEECFQALTLGDGSDRYVLPNQQEQGLTEVNTTVKLPEGLSCERCVLRWHWNTGNNWGTCADGNEGMGCGPQETFRACSDIAIL